MAEDVIKTYEILTAMRVQTGSSQHLQEVRAEGMSVTEAFDSAIKGLVGIIRPALVAQDDMRARREGA